jgi:dihydroorotate dehydrogenase
MLYRLARPLLFRMDPEPAHLAALSALEAACRVGLPSLGGPATVSPRTVMGLPFPNPVGLAAGLDKNGSHIDALATLGFGFLEIGTVTPRPQPGNARPRMFRLPRAGAIINRMGFNNDGVEALLGNVTRARYRGILGINIGKNFDTPIEHAVDDYLIGLRRVFPVASYVTVNISSPNTKNLRQLQQGHELDRLLDALMREKSRLSSEHGRDIPLAVKIAPDLADDDIAQTARVLLKHGVDAVIATNTTVSRDGVAGMRFADEQGGLSGRPLRARATAVVRILHAEAGGRLPIIGAGGIFSAQDAREKMAAGASLVQLYSGLVYEGPGLAARIANALANDIKP